MDEETASERTESLFRIVSLVVATVLSVTALVVGLTSGAPSAVWFLGGTTLIGALGLSAYVYYSRSHSSEKRTRLIWAAATLGVVLSGAWSLVYRDEMLYSRMAGAMRDGPRVLVEPGVAGIALPATAGKDTTRKLVRVVDELIREEHNTTIGAEEAKGPGAARPMLVVRGEGTPTRLSIEVSTQGERSGKATAGLSLKSPADVVAHVKASDRFLFSELQGERVSITISGTPKELAESLPTAIPLLAGLHAVSVGHEKVAMTKFSQFLKRVQLVPPGSPSVGWLKDGILVVARHYLDQGKAELAKSALLRGLESFAEEPRMVVAAAYLHVAAGELEAAGELLAKVEATPEDPALLHAAAGLVALGGNDVWQAAQALERAAAKESHEEAERRAVLQLAVAVLWWRSSGNRLERGDKVLTHANMAERELGRSPLVLMLRGLGWALKQNKEEFVTAFRQARELVGEEEQELYEYWYALGLKELDEPGRARQLLLKREQAGQVGAQILGLLAELHGEALAGIAPQVALETEQVEKALEFAERAIAKDPVEARSHRILGLHEAAQASRATRVQRVKHQEAAIAHFKNVLKGRGPQADILERMSTLYMDLAQTVAAKKAARRATELACQRENDVGACRVQRVRENLDAGDVEAAKRSTNELIVWLNASMSSSRGNQLLNQVAVAWYEAKQPATAKKLYRIIQKQLTGEREFPGKRELRATVDCNLAFVLVDVRRSVEAEALCRGALKVQRSADCEAGRAIALLQLQRQREAIHCFREARKLDKHYGNMDVLRTGYFWSETATSLGRHLVKLDEQTRDQQTTLPTGELL